MNRLLPLIGMMVLVAALTGAAIGWMGWRPFTARRAANQLDANKENPTTTTGTQNLRTNQPATTARNNQARPLGATGSTTAQAPNSTVTQGTSDTAAAQSDANQSVPALW